MKESNGYYYIGDSGERTHLSEILKSFRTERGLNKKKLDSLFGFGMKGYLYPAAHGSPNIPPSKKFSIIVEKLGLSEKDFEFRGIVKRGKPRNKGGFPNVKNMSDKGICFIGDSLLEKNAKRGPEENEYLLSTTYIRSCFGDPKIHSHIAKSVEDSLHVRNRLMEIDPDKYRSIRLSDKRNKGTKRFEFLSDEEKEIIENSLLELVEENYEGKRIPIGVLPEITRRINEHRESIGDEPRTKPGIIYHADNIWYDPGRKSSPQTGGYSATYDSLDDLIREVDEEIERGSEETEKLRGIVDEVIDPVLSKEELEKLKEAKGPIDLKQKQREAKNERKKGFWLTKSSYGHQCLVAFLLRPENFHKYIGEEVVLLDYDLVNNVPEIQPLLEEAKKEKSAPWEDARPTQFARGGVRVDISYGNKEMNELVIVEVKQNVLSDEAIELAIQTLDGYVAIRRGIIERHGLKASVHGKLAAYQIGDGLREDFDKREDRSYSKVPKEEVTDYISRKLGKDISEESVTSSEKTNTQIDKERAKYWGIKKQILTMK